ncbi:MAG: DUF6495 family protein [Putridiphycobacter sp.]|nr:DUF6495 family protein [Putridiphycobacter sp.]
MQKYRKLNKAELITFEQEFVSFLVVNGITADQWVDLKEKDKEKAEAIIEQFSDVIFESILRKTIFIDHMSSKSIKCFQCLEEEIVLVGLDAKEDSDINFVGEQSIASIILNQSSQLSVYTTKKPYAKVREQEMFDMVSKGAVLSKGELFKQISLLL